jgi:hypothetical protein
MHHAVGVAPLEAPQAQDGGVVLIGVHDREAHQPPEQQLGDRLAEPLQPSGIGRRSGR